MKLRQGRDNPHNLYFQVGEEPAKGVDISVGYIRDPRWAKAICEAFNGGVVPHRSFTAETEWQRAEELRTDRLGPEEKDVQNDDPDRPSRSIDG